MEKEVTKEVGNTKISASTSSGISVSFAPWCLGTTSYPPLHPVSQSNSLPVSGKENVGKREGAIVGGKGGTNSMAVA